MKCKKCGNELVSGVQYCGNCGLEVKGMDNNSEEHCPKCGIKILQNWNYCPRCQSPLHGNAAPALTNEEGPVMTSAELGNTIMVDNSNPMGYLIPYAIFAILGFAVPIFFLVALGFIISAKSTFPDNKLVKVLFWIHIILTILLILFVVLVLIYCITSMDMFVNFLL